MLKFELLITPLIIFQILLSPVSSKPQKVNFDPSFSWSIHIWQISVNSRSTQMLNELIQTNKLSKTYTIRVSSKLSKRRLQYFNPNFQEICTAKIMISSSGIKKPFIDSIHYSDYI